MLPRPAALRVLPISAALSLLAACVAAPPRHYDLSSDVLFDFGRPELKPAASDALRSLLAQILASHHAPEILVIGHTDAVGSDAANDALSLRRAQSVQAWLVAAGVPPASIRTQGVGKRQPVAADRNADGSDNPLNRSANRRVELIVSGA